MRAASAEGLGPTLSGTDAQDAVNDEAVRTEDDQYWDKDVECAEAQKYDLIDVSTGTGKSQ